MPGGMMQKLLTVKQGAERLGVGERMVRRLIFEKRIAYVKVGAHVRIDERDLDAYIAANRVEPEPVRKLRRVV